VHAVGGLQDTVQHMLNGFTFTGDSPDGQSQAFVAAVREALQLKIDAPGSWQQVRNNAAAARFSWTESAREYAGNMYDYSAG
jgi:starch synthase